MNNGAKTGLIIFGVIALIAIGVVLWGVGQYNKVVSMDEQVKSQWAQVENQLKRRYDLIPNLVETDFGQLRGLTRAYEAALQGETNRALHSSELNHAFHFHIYRAAGSAVLIPIVESLWLQSGPYVRAAAQIHDESRDLPATHFHWRLIEALERGSRRDAIEALMEDVTRSFNLIRERLGEREIEPKAAKYA